MSTTITPPAGPGEPDKADSHYDPYEDYEIPVEGFHGTPEEIESQWYEKCYTGRGDTIAQLT